jgi:hypothetical protein
MRQEEGWRFPYQKASDADCQFQKGLTADKLLIQIDSFFELDGIEMISTKLVGF